MNSNSLNAAFAVLAALIAPGKEAHWRSTLLDAGPPMEALKRMDDRPEDRTDGEIAEGAGELGFFPPYSWWPLWAGACLSLIVFALAMTQWWMVVLGMALGVLALSGWIFEYYRGEHAH